MPRDAHTSPVAKKHCQPRRGTCSKRPTTKRVMADVRVAWINYEILDMCAEWLAW